MVFNNEITGKVNLSTDVKTTFSKMYHLQNAWFNKEIKYPVAELANIVDRVSMMKP